MCLLSSGAKSMTGVVPEFGILSGFALIEIIWLFRKPLLSEEEFSTKRKPLRGKNFQFYRLSGGRFGSSFHFSAEHADPAVVASARRYHRNAGQPSDLAQLPSRPQLPCKARPCSENHPQPKLPRGRSRRLGWKSRTQPAVRDGATGRGRPLREKARAT